jgi:threonine/homoserine/homoserine lactone efflux protein
MQELVALVGVVAALCVGVVSPGPSFVMVARMAVASSRASALGAAFGMGLGGCLFATTALLGLHGVLHAVPSLYVALKVLGGIYLCYLGLRIFRHAAAPLAVADLSATRTAAITKAMLLGFSTQVSNPKTAIVYASVFAAFLPSTYSLTFASVLLLLVFLVEVGWYALVALLLSARRPQQVYLSWKKWLDRLAGCVMFGLGLRLVTTAAKP